MLKSHDVFLSYSRADEEIMQQVYQHLTAARFHVWIDKSGIEVGSPSWRLAIQEAIESSTCLAVILSPDAKKSKWVNEELSYAQTHQKKIFAILARGDEQESVPFGFSANQWVDIRKNFGLEKLIEQLQKLRTVESLVDFNTEYLQLQSKLQSSNASELEIASKKCRELSRQESMLASQFEILATKLDTSAFLLTVDAVGQAKGYDRALSSFEPYLEIDLPLLGNELAHALLNKYREIQQKSQDSLETKKRIDEGQERILQAFVQLNNQNAEEAYELLKSLRDFANIKQQMQYEEIFEKARSGLREKIISELQRLKIEDDFNIRWLEDRYEKLEKILEASEFAAFHERISIYIEVQHSRDMEATNEFMRARQILEVLIFRLKGAEQRYIQQKIVALAPRILKQQLSYLYNYPDDKETRDRIYDLLQNLQSDLSSWHPELIAGYQAEFTALEIQLLVLLIQSEPDAASAEKNILRVRELSETLSSSSKLAANKNSLPEISAIVEFGFALPDIFKKFRDADKQLTLDSELPAFITSLDAWNNIPQNFKYPLAAFEKRLNDRKYNLISRLSQLIDENPREAETILYSLKLFSLDPNSPILEGIKMIIATSSDWLGQGMSQNLRYGYFDALNSVKQYHNNLKLLKDYEFIPDANRIISELAEHIKTFENFISEFALAQKEFSRYIMLLDTLLMDKNIMGQPKDKEAIAQAYYEAEAAMNRMMRISPNHRDLPAFFQESSFIRAREFLRAR